MPRQSRIDCPGTLHHIIARGIERRQIFNDDQDRESLFERLAAILEQTGTECCAWALIPNHFPYGQNASLTWMHWTSTRIAATLWSWAPTIKLGKNHTWCCGIFGKKVGAVRKRYRSFVETGIKYGQRNDLPGGGLIRSAGG